MDILTSATVFLTVCLCLLKASLSFECPPVRNQLLIADPEDCRNYYHCLPGGRVYIKTCPKGLVFDAKQKVCVWDSFLSCLKPHQKEENQLELNTIVDEPKKVKRLPATPPKVIKKIKKKIVKRVHNKPQRKRTTTRRPTTTRKPTTTRRPSTATTTTSTTTQKPTTTTKANGEKTDLKYVAGHNIGDYPDMAFEDDLNRTEDVNETFSEIDHILEDHLTDDDVKAFLNDQYDATAGVGAPMGDLDDYSSFLFFPNRRLVKREAGKEPATYAYKIACPQAFGYVVEPDNCDTFYHCNNWKPFVKRCPPGLYFDATNFVCNWPHNVNCYEGKRANTYFAFNQMRSEKFSKYVEKPKLIVEKTESKQHGYRVNPSIPKVQSIKTTTIRIPKKATTTIRPPTKLETNDPFSGKTTNLKTTKNEFTARDEANFEEIKSGETIFGKMKTGVTSPTKVAITKKQTTEQEVQRTTRINKPNQSNNNNIFLFGKNPFSKPWIIESHSEEPKVRPTLLSRTIPRNTEQYTTDNHRMNPFTRPNDRYETMKSKTVHLKKSIDNGKDLQRPSIILVDNSDVDNSKYQTTQPRNVKDIYGRIKKVPGHTYRVDASTLSPSTDSTTFKTSSIDYSATSDGNEKTTSFVASTPVEPNTVEPEDTSFKTTDSPKSTNIFEASSTTESLFKSNANITEPNLMRNKMKIRKALADLEPSKYAAQNLTRTNDTTTTTEKILTTESKTTDNTTNNNTDAPNTTDDGTTDDGKTTSKNTYKDTKSIFYTTTMTVVDEKENIKNATDVSFNGTISLNETEVVNNTLASNDTISVNISSFRANLEDLMETYHANFEGISFKSVDGGNSAASSESESNESGESSESEEKKGSSKNTIEGESFAAGKNKSGNLERVVVAAGKNESFAATKNVTAATNNTERASAIPNSNATKVEQSTVSSVSITDSLTAISDSSKNSSQTAKPSSLVTKAVTDATRTATDRRAMMVENKQEVKEVEIDSYMVKMINRGHQPEQSELTESDNMVVSDTDDDPAHGRDKSYKKKAEKWILFGNSDKDKKEVGTKAVTKHDNRYESNEALDDRERIIQEEVITDKTEEDNSITGFNEVESSGDVDRNTIMIDNTDSETKLLEYLATEEEKIEHKSRKYFEAPVPYKRELTIDSGAAESKVESSTSVAKSNIQDNNPEYRSTTTESGVVETLNNSTINKTEESNNNTNVIDKETKEASQNNKETESKTEIVQNDEAAIGNNDTYTVAPDGNSTESETSGNTTKSILETEENNSVDSVTETSSSNVTSTHLNASDATSRATMRLTKSTEKNDKSVLPKAVEVKASEKNTETKKSFISLSDLIKWYLRHWKNYSQWKGGKNLEGDNIKAS